MAGAPVWSGPGPNALGGRYPGRYPLAVESFALAAVAELLPGSDDGDPARPLLRRARPGRASKGTIKVSPLMIG